MVCKYLTFIYHPSRVIIHDLFIDHADADAYPIVFMCPDLSPGVRDMTISVIS